MIVQHFKLTLDPDFDIASIILITIISLYDYNWTFFFNETTKINFIFFVSFLL